MRIISIRIKLLIVLTALVGFAVVSYLMMAVNLFNDDKVAYIYDANAAYVETLGTEISSTIESIQNAMILMAVAHQEERGSSAKRRAIEALFKANSNLAGMALYEVKELSIANIDPQLILFDEAYLEPYGLPVSHYREEFKNNPPDISMLAHKPLFFHSAAAVSGAPLISMISGEQADDGGWNVRLVHLKPDRILDIVSRSRFYEAWVLNEFGEALIRPRGSLVGSPLPIAPAILAEIASSPVRQGVKRYASQIDQQPQIAAFAKVDQGRLTIISQIPEKTAFLAGDRLIKKSTLYAIFIFAVTFIVSLLFTKTLTRGITAMFNATKDIALGNFEVKVDVKSKDELGVLSNSFNIMTSKINLLMKETAEKARLEKEVETAQIVQENFFPPGDFSTDRFELAAFYKPASECGGDWWSHFKLGDRHAIVLGDATGHGIPAALITAAAQSCGTVLQRLPNPEKIGPAYILEQMNASVYYAGKGKVKMTFVAIVLDDISGDFSYSNAAHEPPFLIRNNGSDGLSKDDFEPLLDDPGPILGKSPQQAYLEYHGQLKAGDALVLYTDGITEGRNPDGKEYGERRFVKTIANAWSDKLSTVREQTVKDIFGFFAGGALADDVTLVMLRQKVVAASLSEAA